MRATTGGRALVLPCPQCPTRWSTEQTLAGHLMDAHEMDPPGAVKRALEASVQTRRGRAIQAGQQRAQEEGTPMSDETVATRAPEKQRKPIALKSPKAAVSPNGFSGALQALRAERTELDAAIAALERLEARGR